MAGEEFDYRGWLRLWRKSINSAVFKDANLWHLWSYLMMRANYEERQLLDGRNLKPGQLVISNEKLAERFKCNKSTIHRRMKKLAKLGNIATHSATSGTLVTIVNWPTYNPPPDCYATAAATRPQHGRNDDATRPQPEEEVKKIKKPRSNPPKPPLDFEIEFPAGFDTPDVRLAWNDWLKHKPKKYKSHETAGKALKTYCEEFQTPRRLILGIKLAIAGTWKGLSLDATLKSEKATANVKFRTGPGQRHDPTAAERDPDHGKM